MSTSESSFIRPDGTPARVLVVDDESVLAELLGSALRHQGWETKTAANGWEALDKADTFDPDVVVLDIQMPGLDGMETLERLRKRKPHLPVLFLTARDAVADRVAGLRAGADDYVTKPFDLDEVTARIDALLRRSGMASVTAERVLTVGDLTLDEDSHDVARGRGCLTHALAFSNCEWTIAAVDSDRLFFPHEAQLLADSLPVSAEVQIIESEHGHDGFLIEAAQVERILAHALGEKPQSTPPNLSAIGDKEPLPAASSLVL